MQAFLSSWRALVDDASALVDEALDVDPLGGSSVAWAARLSSLRVAALAEVERLPTCKAERQTRGAPLPEARAALAALEKKHSAALREVVTAAQQPVLAAGLQQLFAHAHEQLDARARAPVKRGLFKHAQAAAARHQYGTSSGPQTEVLECPSCRGPRQQEALRCLFCGSELL